MEQILLVLDTSYEVRCEALAEFNNSIFKDVYNNASKMVKEIIDRNQNTGERHYSERREDEPFCNVIALLGERGSGKSSVLASYCRALERLNDPDFKRNEDIQLSEEHKALANMNVYFGVLNAIDATMLESEEKIIGIILARMLEMIEQKEGEYKSAGSYYDEMEILGRNIKIEIGKIYENLDPNFKKNIDSPILMVKALSNSWNLRDAFKKLVEKFGRYLSYESGIRKEDYYIVIPIDDIDMNVGKCWDMLEMIRKYLTVPKVILLLTFHYEQLSSVCKMHYYKELDATIKHNSDYVKKQVTDLSKEYMEKVIPTGRKIYMPRLYQLDSGMKKQMFIKVANLNGWGELKLRPDQCIRVMIRFYTGVLLDDNRNEYIYPPSIRKLNNFVKEFQQLKILNKRDSEKNLGKFIYNMDWMYHDVTNRFLEQYVGDEERKQIQDYLDNRPEEQNHALAEFLLRRLPDGNEKWKVMIRHIRNKLVLSYGDHLILLCMLRTYWLGISEEAILSWELLVSMKMTRACYEKLYTKNDQTQMKDDDKYVDYLQGDLWGDWDGWYWCYNKQNDSKPIKMEISGNVPQIKIGGIEDSDIKADENKEEKYQELIAMYIIVRIFLDCYDGIQKDEKKEEEKTFSVVNGLFLELDTDKWWKFRLGNFISFIWNYGEKLEQFKEELRKQCAEENYDVIDKAVSELKGKLDEWRDDTGGRELVPFSSTMFMERVLGRFYNENELKEISDIEVEVKNVLDIIESELEMVDDNVEWNEVLKEESKDSLMVRAYKPAFVKCPIVRILRGEAEYKELSEKVYESLLTVLESLSNESRAGEIPKIAEGP